MRVTTLLSILPLSFAAPATKQDQRSLPELSAQDWTSIQSGFVDRVWSGLSDWSFSKAEKIVEYASTTGDEGKTVWQQLKEDEQFSKLVKAIEFAEVKDKFDDPKLRFTFFAPNDESLKPPPGFPHHHHDHDHHDHDGHDSLMIELEKSASLATISSLLDTPSFVSTLTDDKDDDDKSKKRRAIFKYIVKKVLQYHTILADVLTGSELAQNSTFATASKADDGSYAGLHRRITIGKQLVPPAVIVNFYAKVIGADNKASNGIFHVINHPLIPPGSLFDEAYQFPDFFSTLTQSIYGLHAKDLVDYHYDRNASSPGKPKFEGAGLATLFSPTNTAFHQLPGGLKFYLFSPFGEKALAKVLAYHYIPDTLLLSELLVDQRKHKHHDHDHDHHDAEVEYFSMGDDPSFHKEFEIHPALPNSTLHIVVDKTKLLPIEGAVKTTIKVNGEYVLAVDVPARNGASHPIGKLLVPPHKHHDHHGADVSHLDTYENWEEWLPAFAAEV